MQIRRKNLQYYAQAIELHQKYGYGSRKISYIIPVHDRTILIKDLIPTAPHQIWVSDITYIPVILDGDKHDYYYLSLIMDAYTKRIEGWYLSRSLETRGTLMALREAVTRLDASELSGFIHHSDRGAQYTSKEYTDYLRKHQITISMTESGNPKENAEAERLNNTIKNELLCNERFYRWSSLRATPFGLSSGCCSCSK